MKSSLVPLAIALGLLAGCGDDRQPPVAERQARLIENAERALAEGRPSSAGAGAMQALELARARDDRPGQARALLLRARARAASEDPHAADDLAAARLLDRWLDADLRAEIALASAEAQAAAGRLIAAEQELGAVGGVRDPRLSARIIASRAILAAVLQRADDARRLVAQARATGAADPASLALIELAAARTALAGGDPGAAQAAADRAADHARLAEDAILLAGSLEVAGEALASPHASTEGLREAGDRFLRAAEAARAARRPGHAAGLYGRAAEALTRAGDPRAALALRLQAEAAAKAGPVR